MGLTRLQRQHYGRFFAGALACATALSGVLLTSSASATHAANGESAFDTITVTSATGTDWYVPEGVTEAAVRLQGGNVSWPGESNFVVGMNNLSRGQRITVFAGLSADGKTGGAGGKGGDGADRSLGLLHD